jgi:hypothetical protein
MANYNSWDELRVALEQKTKKALDTTVRDYVESVVQNRIRLDVYEAYTPIQYRRSYDLYNSNNFYHYVAGDYRFAQDRYDKDYPDMYLSVGHHAVTDRFADLTKLIILGQEKARYYGNGIALYNDLYIRQRKVRYRHEGNPMNETPFYEPRNFMYNAKMEIQSNRSELIGAFEKGMR